MAKICMMCKWVREFKHLTGLSQCESSRYKSAPDLITGKSDFPFCQLLRWDKDLCGPEGKWWEPKESAHEMVGGIVFSIIPKKKTFFSVLKNWLDGNL